MRDLLIDGRILKHKNITGVERYATNVIHGLRRVFPDMDLAVPNSKNRFFQHLWEHSTLPLKASKYRLLFCPANVCPILKPKSTRFLTTIHDLSFMYYPDSFSFSYRTYYNITTPMTLRLSDAIITVSKFEKDMISSRYPFTRNKIHVIHSGVDDEFFKPAKTKKDDYILYVGNLTKRKNFEGLLVAFKKVYRSLGRKLVIVGVKPDIMKSGRNANDLLKSIPPEFIELKGQINDKSVLADIYAKATAFVFPSFYESFGFPPLEAMASGTPVIASNRGALPEICSDAAYYVDPFNPDSMADAMLKLAKDNRLREHLIEKGKRRAQQFSWSNSIKAHKALIEALL